MNRIEQFAKMSANTMRGVAFINELNACIEFCAYYNGNEEKECAERMMREHLASFDVNTMSVSEKNYATIKRMQEEYGVLCR